MPAPHSPETRGTTGAAGPEVSGFQDGHRRVLCRSPETRGTTGAAGPEVSGFQDGHRRVLCRSPRTPASAGPAGGGIVRVAARRRPALGLSLPWGGRGALAGEGD